MVIRFFQTTLLAILAPDRWLAYLLHRVYLAMKEPFLDEFKVTSETQTSVCGL